MRKKYALIGVAGVFLLGISLFIFHDFKKSPLFGYGNFKNMDFEIESPGCFPPSTKKEGWDFLKKIKNKKTNWKVSTKPNSGDPLAWDFTIYKVVDSGKSTLMVRISTENLLEGNKFFNLSLCQDKKIEFSGSLNAKSGVIDSWLRFRNGQITISIDEWSDDPKRELTQKALKMLKTEFAAELKI